MTAVPGFAASAAALDELGRPVFDGPWQAQAFAIAVRLNEAGHFAWDEWVEVFGAEVKRAPARADESDSNAYYRQWTSALETILVMRGLLSAGDTEARTAEWHQAYINTPHGQAVDLANAICPPAHLHPMIQRGVPIAISSASLATQAGNPLAS